VPSSNQDMSKTSGISPKKMDYAGVFKVNLSKKKASPEVNIFQNLHNLKELPDFTVGKRKPNGSVEMLFQCHDDALKAKKILTLKIESVSMNDPVPKSLRRYNLVGLPFQMDVNEVADALIEENKHLFDLKKTSPNMVSIRSDPSSCIHIHEVNICNNGNEFRITVSMSANMLASLGNYKLCVGYVRCRLYEWYYNKNCNN